MHYLTPHITPAQVTRRTAMVICAASLPLGVFAQSGTSIPLGMTLPLTGAQAELGKSALSGAQAFVKRLNAEGGVLGKPVSLTVLDDEFKPPKTAANLRLLASDGALAVISLIGGPHIAAAQPVGVELEIAIVGVFNGSPGYRGDKSGTIIPVRASFKDEADEIVKLFTSIGMSRFAVVFPDDPVGKAASQAATQAVQAKGMPSAATVAFERTAKDMSPYAAQLDASLSQVAIVFAPTASASALIAALRDRGSRLQVVCMSVVDDRGVWKTLKEKARGVAFTAVVPNPFDINSALVREYQAAMEQAGFKEPSSSSLEGYVNARVAVEGIKRAGTPLTRRSVLKALKTLPEIDLGGARLNRTGLPPGNGLSTVDVVMLRDNGRLVR